jgi:hypothetical protein
MLGILLMLSLARWVAGLRPAAGADFPVRNVTGSMDGVKQS